MTITLKGRNGFVVAAIFFLGAFTIGFGTRGVVEESGYIAEGKVISAGYGSRHIKLGSISHSWDSSREGAEKFRRGMDSDSYINNTEQKYELVEVFYRRINNETSYTGRGISPDQNLDK